MTYRILSLSGGGIRGILTSSVLERIDDIPGAAWSTDAISRSLTKTADMFAGTSTGGILALALAFGLRPADITKLYATRGSEIFDASWARGLSINHLVEARYDDEKLRNILLETFGGASLGDLEAHVVIPTFDLFTGLPRILHNLPLVENDAGLSCVEVALRTSAAPCYFPSWREFIDGGVVANDPSMCAIVRAKQAGIAVDDIALLSVGTGSYVKKITGRDLDWGLAEWGPRIVDLLLTGGASLAAEQAREFLGDRYWRVDPVLKEDIPLDAWQRTDELIALAHAEPIDEVLEWIAEVW